MFNIDKNIEIFALNDDIKLVINDKTNLYLKDLKLYRKVMMHPLSHSTDYGEPNYDRKEIEKTIKLLEVLEKNIKERLEYIEKLKDKNRNT